MLYTKEEVHDFISDNDVKFIRLAFTDVFGNARNISISPSQLSFALEYGISIDASAIKGFLGEEQSDLFLKPDISTLSLLPWRPSHGRVARFYCDILYPDGTYFELDSRRILKDALQRLKELDLEAQFASECEFYLFKKDEYDNPTNIPMDNGGYLQMAPDDRGENVRREICLTLENMHIITESSHHEQGPGQNEIDVRYTDPLSSADDLITIKTVIKTIADNYGLYASFDPKPLEHQPGNGLHINMSLSEDGKKSMPHFMAGILHYIKDMTLFLNPSPQSYDRLGCDKAPKYISWSYQNRSQLIRVPASNCAAAERIELRSPDTLANPYIAYALLIYAGIEGIQHQWVAPEPVLLNLYKATEEELRAFDQLPSTLQDARQYAKSSAFIEKYLPKKLVEAYETD